jgi:hypothetical protein
MEATRLNARTSSSVEGNDRVKRMEGDCLSGVALVTQRLLATRPAAKHPKKVRILPPWAEG